MKKLLSLLILLCLEKALHAQYIYTIKADSVKITNSCDTAELIIENHTQTVPGFLYNKGRGRTEFRKAMIKINDSIYVVGGDTIKLSVAWLQGGNTFGTTGYFGTRDNNHIDFYTNAIKRGRWTNTGNLLLGDDIDYGYKLAVNGTTYSKYYTNSTTPLGSDGLDGALRLRWGGTAGTYIDFYYQDNTNRRGYIGSGSETRPMVLTDKVGLTFDKTPFVSLGSEWPFTNTYFSVTSPSASTLDPMRIAKLKNESSPDSDSYLRVKASGNTILGEGDDNGKRLQVYGSGWVKDQFYVGDNSYVIGMNPKYGNGYAPGVDASMIAFGNAYATIGVNKQNYGSIPANSLILGGVSPGSVITTTDYYGNPTFISSANGQVVINGGYNGIKNAYGGNEVNANSFALDIYGGRGTGTGQPGDIRFWTGIIQSSNTTAHDMMQRWTIKGGSGYLSNSTDPTSMVDINGANGYSQLRLRQSYTPTSSSDTHGVIGDVAWDNNYFYIRTAQGWKRTALDATW